MSIVNDVVDDVPGVASIQLDIQSFVIIINQIIKYVLFEGDAV